MKKIFQTLFFFLISTSVFAIENPLKKIEGPFFQIDLRYNTENNFLKKNVYKEFALQECWVNSDLSKKLEELPKILEEKKVKLVFWDCFRPLAVQEAMWKIVPNSNYVAHPKTGSNHNRGIAVDVGLADENGTLLTMPSEFDTFSPQSSPHFICPQNEKQKCANRDLLIKIMATIGLKPLNSEWWHYQLPKGKAYPLLQKL
jgi:D-alanyl-D-alanine dipeptidase